MKLSVKSIINFALCLIGLGGIAVTRSAFLAMLGGKGYDRTSGISGIDDFFLFFRISIIFTMVLLFLTCVSSFISVYTGQTKGRGALLSKAAPVISSAVILITGIMYSFITGGGLLDISLYIMLTAVSEALVFRLPGAIMALGKES